MRCPVCDYPAPMLETNIENAEGPPALQCQQCGERVPVPAETTRKPKAPKRTTAKRTTAKRTTAKRTTAKRAAAKTTTRKGR